MKTKLLLVGEIGHRDPKPGEDPLELARRQLDVFREVVLPSERYGVTLHEPEGQCFQLQISGQTHREQRRLLERLLDGGAVQLRKHSDDRELLDGLLSLVCEIADQAHDRYGIDCLEPCDCEAPGCWCSGVPGILAHIEAGKVAPDTEVQRCDQCERYDSDEAALAKLKELGHVSSS